MTRRAGAHGRAGIGAAAWAVIALGFVIALWNTWGYDLWAPDEPYFGEGAREMIVDGQWLVPHVNGVITTDKPPLFFWLIALASLPFGHVLSLTARLPSILAGTASVALTIRLGRRMGGEKSGLLAGFVMATAYLPWDKARSAQIDAVLCLLVLAALSLFEAFRSGDLDGRTAGAGFWALGALATLAKGPVGILVPLGIALVTLALDRDLRSWRRFAPFLGPAVFVAVVALWAVPAELFGGEYSMFGALKKHFLLRALHGMHHKNPPWYYLGAIPLQFLPWTGLLVGGLVLAWRRRRERADRFLLVWLLFVVVFFSVSGERRDLYVLPAYPALALLVARLGAAVLGWDSPGGARPARGWITIPQGLLGALLLVGTAVVPALARRESASLAGPALTLAVFLAVFGVVLVALALLRRAAPLVIATGAGMAVVYLVTATIALPAFDPLKSARPFALAMARDTAAYRATGGRVLAFRLGNVPEALSFFSGVYTVETDAVGDLVQHLRGPEEAYAVIDRKQIGGDVPAAIRSRLVTLESADLSRRDVNLVVNRGAPSSPPAEAAQGETR